MLHKGCSLIGAEHTYTNTRTHTHTCTRDLCSILSASSSPHSMVPNTNQQIACFKKKRKKKKAETAPNVTVPSSGYIVNRFSQPGFLCSFSTASFWFLFLFSSLFWFYYFLRCLFFIPLCSAYHGTIDLKIKTIRTGERCF